MKKQIKKSLSLFLAVLMVLSCWVCVAPIAADAITNNNVAESVTPADKYKVRTSFNITDALTGCNGKVEVKVWYITNNGTGTAAGPMSATSSDIKSVKRINVDIKDIPGFPYYIEAAVYRDTTVSTNDIQHAIAFDGVYIGNGNTETADLFGDQYTIGQRTGQSWSEAYGFLLNGFNTDNASGKAETKATYTASGEHKPYVAGFDSYSTTDVALTLNKIGGADVSAATSLTASNYFDQYGVKWHTHPANPVDAGFTASDTYIINSGNAKVNDTIAENLYFDDKDGSATKGQIVAKAGLQAASVATGDATGFSGYLVRVFANKEGIEYTVKTGITITYQKHTITFDGAGSISGLSHKLFLNNGSYVENKSANVTGYYGVDIGTADKPVPTGDATAAGYTFKGLWTEKQPSEGNASYNAISADFAEPITSEKFEEYVENGGTVDAENGKYITYEEKLYYNAGTQWDPKSNKLTADTTYYGWWISTDLTIKFYDINGKYLGTETVKYGQTHNDITWPEPQPSYQNGPYSYSNFTGIWVNKNGDEINQNGCIFTDDLVLTPKYDKVTADKVYSVIFANEAGGNISSKEYSYRTDLTSVAGAIPADRNVPNGIKNDLQFSYTFEGWSVQKPSGKNYHILLEDSDFDEAGAAIAYKTAESDWVVRSDMTFYPVYRRHVRTYAVNFWYKDSAGNDVSRQVTVKYGEALKAPVDYVPFTYAKEGYGYTFENWIYFKSGEEMTFGYNNTLTFTKENIDFDSDAEADGVDVTPIGITAGYGEGVPTPYTVTFKYMNDKGEVQTHTTTVNHGDAITEEDVEKLSPAEEYDNGEAMVSFTGNWNVLDGAADKTSYATSEFTSFEPTSHITFEAVYGNPQPFYTVTYIDGAAKYEERILVGSELPVWTNKVTDDKGTEDPSDDETTDVEYIPSKADSDTGSYTFMGWYDEKQTDTTFAATNGNKYEKGSKVTGNITLYSQFKFSPFTYTITFMNHDGTVQLAAFEFEYGQNIEWLVTQANRAANAREKDETYEYEFLGWDKPVPTFCEGKDMTFTAIYKNAYRYYEAKWYNSVGVEFDENGVVTKWAADTTETEVDGVKVEPGLLKTTKHTYKSKVYNPSVAANCTVTAPAGQNYVFDGWYYNDAEGNAQPFVRGMEITDEMTFYATYKLTAKMHTVTTVVNGETEEYQVADGNFATIIGNPVDGYVDAEKHNKFSGWVTKDEEDKETAFVIADTAITANITLYAKFEESEHEYDYDEEIIKKPDYYNKGEAKQWCSCGATQTVETDVLADTKAPTGTIYLGTQGHWSSTDTVGGAALDKNEDGTDKDITLYANANTDVIITANDAGIGVKTIRAFLFPAQYVLTAQNYGAAQSLAETFFYDDSQDITNTANFTKKLGAFEVADLTENGEVQYEADGITIKKKNLTDGEAYIVYYYVLDKANNNLNTKVRTAKFWYDSSDPEFTVEGNNNVGKVTGTPTYCGTATVTGIEEGATLTVNDAVIEDVADTYVINNPGNYFVTVTDEAGNSYSKKFEVADGHSYHTVEVPSTCTVDGYKTQKCIVCDYEAERITYTAPGHVTSISVVPATCTEKGYNLITCANCDYRETIATVVDENGKEVDLYPALGHNYDTVEVPAEEGGEPTIKIVYKVITEATCSTKGMEIATCKDCGETIENEIPLNPDAHNWGAKKTLKPTCTEAGSTYQVCKLCYTRSEPTTIRATGHEETKWVVTTAATCNAAGVETLTCKKCNAAVDSDDEDTVADTRAIPATGRHILAVSDDPTKTFDATAEAEGQITRYCTQCGQEWVEKVAKIEKYTVKFVDEDGTTVLAEIKDIVSGTTLEKTAVTEPTKDNSTDGKFKYTFAGWKDENGKSVTLPFDVTANITLKATYTQSTIIYTHIFKVPTTWTSTLSDSDYDVFATMMGAMGDSRAPVAAPVFKLADAEADAELKKNYSFKFLGWSTTGAKGDIVTNFTITGDATFIAVFEAVPAEYQVTYYNGTNYVWHTTVKGGESVTFGGTEPTKAPDAEYHYTFNGWYTDATLKTPYEDGAITAKTSLYAGFTATAHNWDVDAASTENKAATCTEAAKVAKKCSVCAATKVETEGNALGHTPAAAVTETAADGTTYSVVYCARNCGYEFSRTKTSVTVEFKVGTKVVDLQTLNIGDAVAYKGTADDLKKASDDQYSYTFAGWYVDGDAAQTLVNFEGLKASADVVYIAKFTGTTRTYRVTYVDVDNKTIQTFEGIAYGAAIPAFTKTAPTKDHDADYHYSFKGWKIAAGATVTGDLVIKPEFTATKHSYKLTESTATCDKPGTSKYQCTACAYGYEGDIVPAIGHNYKEISRVQPNYESGKDGKIVYKCENCGNTYDEKLSAEKITVNVTIKDSNNAPRVGIEVTLLNVDTGSYVPGTAVTNENGVATFKVAPGKYKAYIVGTSESTGDITVKENGKVSGSTNIESNPVVAKCKCACHKTTFWGVLFRLLHKFIKLFTGKYTCCDCPSDLY